MGVNIRGVIKGALISLFITAFILFILALLAYFTGIGENIITIGAYAAVITGALAGAVIVAMSAPNKKFAHVMLVCLVYTAALVAASFAMNGKIAFNAHTAAIVGGIFAAAFLGLVIGNR